MSDVTTSKVKFVGLAQRPQDVAVGMLFVPVLQDADALEDLPGVDRATHGEISRARAAGEFRGKAYEFFITPVVGPGWKARRIVLVGAGPRAGCDIERLRRIASACGYTAQLRSVDSVAWLVRPWMDSLAAAQAAADGLSTAEFDGATHRHKDDHPARFPGSCAVIAPGANLKALGAAVSRGRVIGGCANAARRLANEPGNLLTPRVFASRIRNLVTPVGLAVDVLDEKKMRTLGMGLLLGVAQGSAEPPRLIVISYNPPRAPKSPVIGLVGKGVTFDSGGISIKPADGMERMKSDMSGGAAVAAAMRGLALLKSPYRALAVIPAVENMPGGRAIRPGDVLTGASGKTVEVINTDAEGRLILGDALWYAQRLGATHLVDVATLTGACMVALGRSVSGLFGAPESWIETVRGAARRTGDRVWPLPIDGDYPELLRSEIADIVNSTGRAAGAITAACFLQHFVEDRPWAHLDIAGTAWAEDRKAYMQKGATGVAVRLLIELGMTGGGLDRRRAD